MKVEVVYNEFTNWAEPICVTFVEDGEIVGCNHAATEIEREEFGHASTVTGTYNSSSEQIEVCRKCSAWRFVNLMGS